MRHNDLIEHFTKLNRPKPKQKELAAILGCDIGKIGKRASRNSEYTLPELLLIEQKYNVGLLENVKHDIQNLVPNAEIISDDEFVEVNYYPEIFGSCGTGTFVLSETKEKFAIPKKIIQCNNFKKYSVINAYGDSMSPLIEDKDKLIVEHWEGEQIKDNRVYVFRLGDNIFIKRLVLNIDQIVIKSDNNLYPARFIDVKDTDNFQVIGEIIGLIRDMK